MTPAQRLLLEAGALVLGHESPFCRRAAALEVSKLSAADLVTRSPDLSNISIAIRATVVAIDLARSVRRRHLIDALGSLLDAAREPPEPESTAAPSMFDRRRLYWMEK